MYTNTYIDLEPKYGSVGIVNLKVIDLDLPSADFKFSGSHKCDAEKDFPWIAPEDLDISMHRFAYCPDNYEDLGI
jgi:hypothetical protein